MTDDPLDLNAVKLRGTDIVHFTSVKAFVAMNKSRWGNDAPDKVQTLINEAEALAQVSIDYMAKQDMANATAYRSAAMLRLTELDGLWSNRKKSESVTEGNSKRGDETKRKVFELRDQYIAANTDPSNVAGKIASKLGISDRRVRQILKKQ